MLDNNGEAAKEKGSDDDDDNDEKFDPENADRLELAVLQQFKSLQSFSKKSRK